MGREKERERKRERARARMHTGERVREKTLSLLLLYVFSSTWACPMQIGLSQECCLFCLSYLKSSLWSSDLPCLLATAILDSFSLFYLPNTTISSPSLPAFNLSQHQGLSKWVSSSHQVAKVLEFQLQHQSFQ